MDVYSEIESLDLRWIRRLIVIIAAFSGVTLLDFITTAAFDVAILEDVADGLYEVLLVMLVGFYGLQQRWTRIDFLEPIPEPDGSASLKSPEPSGTAYARSALTAEDCARLCRKLDAVMTTKALWKQPFLGLRDLVEETGITANHISQALNTHLGRNFYDYVNGWRVQDACTLLEKTDSTVLQISLDVGFNSKSTFNAAFKKAKGCTPTAYRKHGPRHSVNQLGSCKAA